MDSEANVRHVKNPVQPKAKVDRWRIAPSFDWGQPPEFAMRAVRFQDTTNYHTVWSSVILLKATPVIADCVDIVFSISVNGDILPHWIKRAEWHFQLLNLDNLYREHASVELVQRKSAFRATYSAEGSIGLKEDLELEADSRSKPFPNAWQPALYRGLSAREEFCEGGFEKIEEQLTQCWQ
jgi:hypothetical protein